MTADAFVLHGTTLALVWFLAINVLVTGIVAAVAPRLTRAQGTTAPSFWLAVRLLPAAASLVFIAAVFVPSYWRYEPRELVEGFDAVLAVLAAAALVLCAAAAVRGTMAHLHARQRVAGWLRVAQPLTVPHVAIPAFRLEVDAPMMALVGVLRPRLFITRGVLDALTDEELHASVQHELGHWRAADNVKRLVMRAAPDLFSTLPAARVIERRWASAAEHVADRRASEGLDPVERARARCALASALVKVARLTPPSTPLGEPISTLVDGGDVVSRVRSLLADTPPPTTRSASAAWIAATAAVVAAVLTYAPALQAVHALTELIVQSF